MRHGSNATGAAAATDLFNGEIPTGRSMQPVFWFDLKHDPIPPAAYKLWNRDTGLVSVYGTGGG